MIFFEPMTQVLSSLRSLRAMTLGLALLGGSSQLGMALTDPDKALPYFEKNERPPRIGFMSFNREMDQEKTLAAIDTAGFVYNSGVLVGAVDRRWVMGMSWNSRKDLWWIDGGSLMTAPPGSFGSHIVLGFLDGLIKKVDVLTGKVVWETRLDSFTESGFVLSGTKLYVLTAAQILHAIDFQSGQTLWVYDGGFPDGLTIRGRTKPIVHDGKIYLGVSSGELICVDAQSGKLEWRQNPDFIEGLFHDFVGELHIKDQTVIFARFDGLVGAMSINGPTRNLIWKREFPSLTTMAVRGPRLYLGGVNGDIVALNLGDVLQGDKSGAKPSQDKELWRYATGLALATFTVSEDLLIAAGVEGRITALHTTSGLPVWYEDLQSSLVTPPVVVERGLYFITGLKSLYGYQLQESNR
jgi:outer membrane protein assembly factor BamB